MFAFDILWNVDTEEGIEKLDNMTSEEAAKALGIPTEAYNNMSSSERHDYAFDLWHHSPATLLEFMGVPDMVEIPAEIADDPEYSSPEMKGALIECISDWLSDEYGFCHEGFEIDRDYEDFVPDREMVDFWMDKFLDEKVPFSTLQVSLEIKETKGTISNEALWAKGSDSEEAADMHKQNIANLLEYLKELKALY